MLKTLTPPRRRKEIHIGPADDGRAMSLTDFDRAVGQEGYQYELSKGIIQVTNIPHPLHFVQMSAIRDSLIGYKLSHPGVIQAVGGSFETKVLIDPEQSERHPDISVYQSPMPTGADIWSVWIPTIAFEIVSVSSAKRDYEEKPDEYLAFGIQEYCIVDAFKKQMLVMSRYRGAWREKVLKPAQSYTTPLLPGFKMPLKSILTRAQ
jgi:Putative restriction endonuclease